MSEPTTHDDESYGAAEVAVETVARRAAAVRDRIRSAGGDPAAITLVAVTKAFGPDVLRVALGAGLHDVGENYAGELITKADELGPAELATVGARFHFLGRLQRNKVRRLAPYVHLWQSVDRPELGQEIARRVPGAAVLAQVNVTAEPQKGGCAVADAPRLVEQLRALDLDVRGLMGVGAAGDADRTVRAFAGLTRLAISLDLSVRSMGMSGDLEVAVREGTTMVRIGRSLFGDRPVDGPRVPGEQEKRLE